jgi:hypothetical protein
MSDEERLLYQLGRRLFAEARAQSAREDEEFAKWYRGYRRSTGSVGLADSAAWWDGDSASSEDGE